MTTAEAIINHGMQDGLWDQDNSPKYAYSKAAQALYRHGQELAQDLKAEDDKVAKRQRRNWSHRAEHRKALGKR